MQIESTEKGSIHYAQYEKSERLQRFLQFMLDGMPHTTLEIIQGASVCAVNSAACELRRNGFKVMCIKKSNPAIYQLFDEKDAAALSTRILTRREAV